MTYSTVLDQIQDKFTIGDDCWLWHAAKTPSGYGKFWRDKRSHSAHRVMYELMVGPIPEGMEIDHLCRVRHCVRPDHMEPVTLAENQRRGYWASRTHCKNGHEYTPENLYTAIGKRQGRVCRRCTADAQRRYQARKKA